MSRFILIDNSISDTAGHYFQYAAFCLKAAESLGFEPILVTNKKYSEFKKTPWKTIPVYHFGFWVSQDKSSASGIFNMINKISKSIKKSRITLFIKLKFSIFGLLLAIGNDFPKYLRNRLNKNGNLDDSKLFLVLMIVFLGLPGMIYLHYKSKSHEFKTFNKIKHMLKFLIEIIFPRANNSPDALGIFDARKKMFAKDTGKLFHEIGIHDDDHIFIPTAGLTEILGIVDFVKTNPNASGITWHFLFRRDLFYGFKYRFEPQIDNVRKIRNAILILLDRLPKDKVFFYTDTDELTRQYDELGVVKFTTLPIPHTHRNSSHTLNSDKIIISYLGDARTEKGYHLLPRMVMDLWNKYVKSDKVIFKIQSNFNVSGGEPKPSIAKSQLESFPAEKVQLFSNPLSMKEYENLLLNSGIIILPYDPMNYFARSSGILAEALTIGVPVIVPSGSWLSRQFTRRTYEYHMALKKELISLDPFLWKKLKWISYGKMKVPFYSSDFLLFSNYSQRLICDLQNPRAEYCIISFNFTGEIRDSVVCVIVRQKNFEGIELTFTKYVVEQAESFEKGTIFLKLEAGCREMLLEFFNIENGLIKISNFQIDFFNNSKKGKKIPLGVIGSMYSDEDSISNCVREVVDNYQHYFKSAKEFSNDYYKFHNAENLVTIILQDFIKPKKGITLK